MPLAEVATFNPILASLVAGGPYGASLSWVHLNFDCLALLFSFYCLFSTVLIYTCAVIILCDSVTCPELACGEKGLNIKENK